MIHQQKTEHLAISFEFKVSRRNVVTSRSQDVERDIFRLGNWSHKTPIPNYNNKSHSDLRPLFLNLLRVRGTHFRNPKIFMHEQHLWHLTLTEPLKMNHEKNGL